MYYERLWTGYECPAINEGLVNITGNAVLVRISQERMKVRKTAATIMGRKKAVVPTSNDIVRRTVEHEVDLVLDSTKQTMLA